MMSQYKCFVMMPIQSGADRDRWFRILAEIIRPAIQGAGFDIEVKRNDEIPSNGNWLKSIVCSTYEADIVVADLTGQNPNVMWELGLRHGSKKHGTIMITQDALGNLASDLKSYNVISYREDKLDFDIFSSRIKDSIASILDSPPGSGCDSPYYDFVEDTSIRTREIDVRVIVGSDTASDQIVVRKLTFDEPRPTETEDQLYHQNEIIPRDGGYNSNELDAYHKKLKVFSKNYAQAVQTQWIASRAEVLGIKILPVCYNHSDQPLKNAAISIQLKGDGRLYEELPDKPGLPIQPTKPKHAHETQMESLFRTLPGFMQQGYVNARAIVEPIPTKFVALRSHESFKGCFVDDERGTSARCKTEAIRQQSLEDRWGPLYFVPGEHFTEGVLEIEIRSDSTRGVVRKTIPILLRPDI